MRKNLVIAVVGNESIHELWIKENRNYDVVLICYEDDVYNRMKGTKGIKVLRKNGFKFPLTKWYIETRNVDKYERFLFLDHDIAVSTDEINTCFELQKEFKVEIGHPAINPKNNPNRVLMQNPDASLTWVNWVELMAVFMTKEALAKTMPYFDENNTGYGYPDLWYQLLNIEFAKFDKVEIIHTRPINTGNSIYKANNQTVNEAKKDMIELHKKYNLSMKGYKEGKIIPNKPLATIVVIYSEQDEAKYLHDNIATSPFWAERIYCKTVPTNEKKHGSIEVIVSEGGVTKAEYYYKPFEDWNPLKYFNFADARNKAHSLAKSFWIISMDADERLLQQQHNRLFEYLRDAPKQVGGFYISNVGLDTSRVNELGQYARNNVAQVRIFRNVPELYYQDGIHETGSISLQNAGYELKETEIVYYHAGYEITIPEMMEKQRRNILGYVNNPELLKSKGHFEKFIETTTIYKYYKENEHGIV